MEQQKSIVNEGATFAAYTPPKVKGWYVLGSTNKLNTISFSQTFKPKWLHRQMMRIFFGWYWVDEK